MLCDVLPQFFFLMIRRPPRSTLDRSSAASDVYKRQLMYEVNPFSFIVEQAGGMAISNNKNPLDIVPLESVSYTHLRAHETVLDLVCRLLLEKKKRKEY